MKAEISRVKLTAFSLVAMIAPCAFSQSVDVATLRAFTGLTPDQWNAVTRGAVEARVLDTREKREVAVMGVAYLHASTSCLVARFQDIAVFKKNPAVLRIRKFKTPGGPQDLAEFALEPRDIADLRNCTVGHCSVRLSAEMIGRLRREVDWSSPDYAAQAQSVIRAELLTYIETYLREGDKALIVYHDKSNPVPLAREFSGVLNAKPGLADYAPDFRAYLESYPAGSLPGVTDFLYWSTEAFGLKPVASITHVFLYVQPGHAAFASKQIYASHYFDASVGLTAALDDTDDPAHPGMYLIYLNRSRIDLLSGFFGPLRRAILRGRLRDGMRRNLTDVVRKLESSCAEPAGADSVAP